VVTIRRPSIVGGIEVVTSGGKLGRSVVTIRRPSIVGGNVSASDNIYNSSLVTNSLARVVIWYQHAGQ
jgi:hypothetical protein